jgi:hypothetical protein
MSCPNTSLSRCGGYGQRLKSVPSRPVRQLRYPEAIVVPLRGYSYKSFRINELHRVLVAFTCHLTVLFATILAVCKRNSRILSLGLEPVRASSNVDDKRDIELHRGGHFMHSEFLKFGQFVSGTLENKLVMYL